MPARTKPASRRHAGRRLIQPAAALLVCASALALGATSCGGRTGQPPAQAAAPEERSPWALDGGRLALIVSPEGLLLPISRGGGLPYGDTAALPFAVQTAAAALASADGRTLMAAINRVGLASWEPGADRAPEGPAREPAFQGRSVGGFIAAGDGLALFLYRHPYFEEADGPGEGGALLHAAGSRAATAALLAFAERNADLYSLFPADDGRYFFQTRRVEAERAYAAYGLFDAAAGSQKTLERAAFEAALAMEPLDAAPPGLRAAAGLLPDRLILSARLEGGGQRAYLRGKIDEAAPAMAVGDGHGTLALAEDGRAGYASPDAAVGAALRLDFAAALAEAAGLAAPDPLWRFREPALLDGYAACVWEEGAFPLVARSGIVILALP